MMTPRERFKKGSITFTTRWVPTTLTSKAMAMSSEDKSLKRPIGAMVPALLTKMSSAPYFSPINSAAESMALC